MNNRSLRYCINKLIKEELDSDTHINVIGKSIRDAFPQLQGINSIGDKIITYSKIFNAEEGFNSLHKAKQYLENQGYKNGSMYMDYPIPFIKNGKFGVDDLGTSMITDKWGENRPIVITKWDKLSQESINGLDGVIIPITKGFRDGGACIIFFEFPN